LIDFSKLGSHVSDCGRPFREAVLDYLRLLGESRGFVVRENSSVIKYGLPLGKFDLAWVDVKTIFFVEFATLENILRDLWLALEFDPKKVVFVLSSSSKASPKAVRALVSESDIARSLLGRIVLVDVGGRKIISL